MKKDLIEALFARKQIKKQEKKILEKTATIPDFEERINLINKSYAYQLSLKNANSRYQMVHYQDLVKGQRPQGYPEKLWVQIVNCYKKVLRILKSEGKQFEMKLN
ncbi:hypothetical protein IT403_01095 [Candidatus Nomurabacteria bacterium]|nr:hypothetical protein [Candidatus Nomurabacteria bacterium]